MLTSKISLAILSLALALPITSFAAFSDVSTNHRYYNEIEWARNLSVPAPTTHPPKLIEGYSDGTFKPDAPINRAEFLKIVIDGNQLNLGGHAGISITQYFSDTEPGSWYTTHLASAKEIGIIEGYPDGTFRPAQSITLVEAAKILVLSKEANKEALFVQELTSPSQAWYEVYLEYLQLHDAIPPTVTALDTPITRAEMVYIMYQLAHDSTQNHSFKEGLTITTPTSWGSWSHVPDISTSPYSNYRIGLTLYPSAAIQFEDVSDGTELQEGCIEVCKELDSNARRTEIENNPDGYVGAFPARIIDQLSSPGGPEIIRSYYFYTDTYKVVLTFLLDSSFIYSRDFTQLEPDLMHDLWSGNGPAEPIQYLINTYPEYTHMLQEDVEVMESVVVSVE